MLIQFKVVNYVFAPVWNNDGCAYIRMTVGHTFNFKGDITMNDGTSILHSFIAIYYNYLFSMILFPYSFHAEKMLTGENDQMKKISLNTFIPSEHSAEVDVRKWNVCTLVQRNQS